jgi:hypothetical protein
VDGDDVRVVKAGEDSCLGQVRLHVGRVRDPLGVRDFDRYRAVKLVVVGQIDDAETATPQDPVDPIASDPHRQLKD